MSSVMIRCPRTGCAVSTAIEMEPNNFRNLANLPGRMHCPACGQEHIWAVRSAWLSDESRSVARGGVPAFVPTPGSEAA